MEPRTTVWRVSVSTCSKPIDMNDFEPCNCHFAVYNKPATIHTARCPLMIHCNLSSMHLSV